MRYEVKCVVTGEVIESHENESDAIATAETLENVRVVAHEVSGTYESRSQVWPERGPTYSN